MKYEEPKMLVTVFSSEDIIKTSGYSTTIPAHKDENVDGELWL